MECMQLHKLHARFLTAGRRAPGTISYYRDCTLRLTEFLRDTERGDAVENITTADLRELMLWLRERGLKPGGEHAVMRGVRALLRWGFEEEILERDPTKRLKLAAPPKALPPATTPQEAREALRLCALGDHPLRDKAVLLTFLDTGIRMGELIRLKVGDVDLERGVLIVRAESAKSRTERTIPFGVKLGRAINNYERRERKPARESIESLFLTRSGTPLTKGAVEHLMFSLSERMGVPRSHVAPHAWRRAFATSCLRSGVDVHALRLMMGHATLEQTMVYARYLPEDLQRAHMRASPADRL